jgi:hypothetical protein
MRVYIGKVKEPMKDIRAPRFIGLHNPHDYAKSQAFGKTRRESGDFGLVYNSVRHAGGECIAVFRPRAVSIPIAGPALGYVWDGKQITQVYEKKDVLFELIERDSGRETRDSKEGSKVVTREIHC